MLIGAAGAPSRSMIARGYAPEPGPLPIGDLAGAKVGTARHQHPTAILFAKHGQRAGIERETRSPDQGKIRKNGNRRCQERNDQEGEGADANMAIAMRWRGSRSRSNPMNGCAKAVGKARTVTLSAAKACEWPVLTK